jgi:hypothetical protein
MLVGWMLAASTLQAQDVRATARADSTHMLIGDWLTLSVEIEHPADVTVSSIEFADSLRPFEIVRQNQPTRTQSGGSIIERGSFTLTVFDSGFHVIPPLRVTYSTAADTTRKFVESMAIPVRIGGIVVDTTAAIKDIKPPLGVPITFAEILPYLIGVLLLGGIGWLVYYILKKRRRGETIIPAPPPRPPRELAIEALRALESEQLWQRGKVKEFHSKLSDILRTYIEREWRVLAMEMTTDEILTSPFVRTVPQDARRALREILIRADLVKFAKFQPQANENDVSMRSAFEFVEHASLRTAPNLEAIVQEVS